MQWSVDDVSQYLTDIGLGSCVRNVLKNSVDGYKLANITDREIAQIVPIPVHRRKLSARLASVRAEVGLRSKSYMTSFILTATPPFCQMKQRMFFKESRSLPLHTAQVWLWGGSQQDATWCFEQLCGMSPNEVCPVSVQFGAVFAL